MTPDHRAQTPPETGPFGDLAANVEEDLGLLAELAGVFLRECPEMIGNIRTAIERKNSLDLGMAAHKFKGCVGVFTTRGPFACTSQLETMARENDLAGADQALRELEDQVCALAHEMKKLLPDVGN